MNQTEPGLIIPTYPTFQWPAGSTSFLSYIIQLASVSIDKVHSISHQLNMVVAVAILVAFQTEMELLKTAKYFIFLMMRSAKGRVQSRAIHSKIRLEHFLKGKYILHLQSSSESCQKHKK